MHTIKAWVLILLAQAIIKLSLGLVYISIAMIRACRKASDVATLMADAALKISRRAEWHSWKATR